MNVSDALNERSSIRGFRSDPIPEAILNEILETALKAPSWCNVQPFKLAVAQGAVRDDLAKNLSAKWDTAAATGQMSLPAKLFSVATKGVLPDGDFDVQFNSYPSEFIERRQECGYGLYSSLGISREDRAARDRQTRRNFEFFDAPIAMFLFTHSSAREYGILDAGLFLQSLMLVAQEKGLGTCAQGALATWRSPLEKTFNIPPHYKLLCGLSLGYPNDDPINQYSPDRMPREDLMITVAQPSS